MKKLLYTILVIEILATAFSFFVNLELSFDMAFINLLLDILSMVPIIAIIVNIDSIEQLKENLDRVRCKLKNVSDEIHPKNKEESIPVPSKKPVQIARGIWECVKCGTVNKAGTGSCINCKAEYSAWDNPTDSPYKTKKVSRWVK